MTPAQHLTASTIVSGIVFAVTKSWPMTISSWLGGFMADVDHLIDFCIEFGPRRFTIREFFRVSYERVYKRGYLFLHGWEWIVVGYLCAWLSGWNPWVLGTMIGYTHHLVLDQFYNGPRPSGYSLIYRMVKGWEYEKTFYEELPKSKRQKFKESEE